ncbi:MAG: TonB-dependent receptor [Lewinellaceae bacterium]|nr:TonB-dependent receptor [Lewinellaceae bacterium]
MRLVATLCLLSAFVFPLYSQAPQQTVRGVIVDADTRQPLAGATVSLPATGMGAVSDTLGRFRIDAVPVGRYQVEVRYIGYESLMLQETLVESGRETVLQLELQESPSNLEAVEVSASRSDIRVPHPLSVKALTVEETRRFPATFFDPARLATAFAGVVNDNDQANGLVIRGNSPNGLAWWLEGVEIVNPNHTPNAGTFSDRVTQNGGGVNILSAQMLGTSHFYTGAFPASYGNVLSGVLDMRLRPGNNERHERTLQAGLIGLDLAAEGPLARPGRASYLANYRYSTVGLITQLGIDFGDEQINFQDFSFHLSFPGKKGGSLTFFGLGGLSENLFRAERDSSLWEFAKDRYDIIFRSRMGALGATFTQPLGKRCLWRTVVAVSALHSTRTGSRLDDSYTALLREKDEREQSLASLHSWVQYKLGAGSSLRLGLLASRHAYSLFSLDNSADTLVAGAGNGLLWQPYANWSARLGAHLRLNAGLHWMYFGLSESSALEPRLSLAWLMGNGQQLSLAYGLHSQLQAPQLYFATNKAGGEKEPGFTRAHHLVLGYRNELSTAGLMEVEAFYQYLFDVPVAATAANSFSALNLLEGLPPWALANEGSGENYGVELSLQQYLTRGYFFLFTGTYYESTYKGSDGVKRDTRYNGNYIANITAGKEWERQKGKGRVGTWGLNGRVAFVGGFRDTPIDLDASAAAGHTVFRDDEAFTIRQKGYFRADLRVYRAWNRSKFNSILALDVQNLANTQNLAFRYYDAQQRQVVEKYQLGLIPILTYRIEF